MMVWKYGRKDLFVTLLVLDVVVALQNVFLAFVTSYFIQSATSKDMKLFIEVASIAVVGFAIISIVNWLHVSLVNKIIRQVNVNIKRRTARYLLNVSRQSTTAESISKMTGDLKLLETNGISNELKIVEQLLTILGAIAGGIYFDSLTTLVFVLGSLVPLELSHAFQKRIQVESKDWSESNSQYISALKDILAGSTTIRLYLIEKLSMRKVDERVEKLEQNLCKMNGSIGHVGVYTTFAALTLGVVMPFGFGIYRTISGAITLAAFMGVVQISNSISNPLMRVISEVNSIQTTVPVRNFVGSVFDTVVPDAEDAKLLSHESFTSLALNKIRVVKQDKVIIDTMSLDVSAGEKILIKAPSGYGKTTLLKVLIGELGIDSGEYILDGKVVNNPDDRKIRGKFSLINQEPFLFNDTIAFNITLGEKFKESELLSVIERVGLRDLVDKDGLNYLVGENGGNLSGGQAQRIEIARALIRNRPIVLADEVTSSLDERSSQQVHKLLLSGEFTLIEVAHHIDSKTEGCFDRVIVYGN